MTLKKSCPLLVAALLLCAPLAAQAAEAVEVIDGGTCIPYPPYERAVNSFSGINYQHWLYGFNGIAFCHLTMTQDWPLNSLSYVLFTGFTQPDQVVTARLCVHAFDLAVTCGDPARISGEVYQVNWVLPPSLPPRSDGAFVQFNFPSNSVSGITEVIPVWSNNTATNAQSALAQSASSPEQHLAAINDARRQSTDYVNGLAAALQLENRDNGWATQTESALRGSFAAEGSLPHDALRSVECRSTKCNLEVNLGAGRSPAALVEQQVAITHWISVTQPCTYTMTNPAAQTIRIFLNCKR